MKKLMIVTLLVCHPLMAHAAWVQYRVSDFQVVGAFENQADMRLDAETAPLEIPGVTVATIPWPIPVGCTKGQIEWTLVTPPGELPLVLQPGIIVFNSTSTLMVGCRQVANWRELQSVVNTVLLGAIPDRVAASGVLGHWTWYQGKCYDAPQNAQCQAWLANLVVMLSIVPGRGQGVTASGQGATLVQDALALKATQGW